MLWFGKQFQAQLDCFSLGLLYLWIRQASSRENNFKRGLIVFLSACTIFAEDFL